MSSAGSFLADCIRSGELFASFCALIIVPPGTWLVCRALAPAIKRMHDDPAWQAAFAAIATAMPGTVFLALAFIAILKGLGAACLALPAGKTLFGLVVALLVGGVVWATSRSLTRAREIRALVRTSRPAPLRLRTIAESLKLNARLLTDRLPMCALAGFRRPIALVSVGALDRLSDAELRAALLHERAHACRADQYVAACVVFIAEMLPLPAGDLIATYWSARELAADRHALNHVPATDLAAALIHFAKGACQSAALASFAGNESSTIERRLRVLLADRRTVNASGAARRFAIAAVLSICLVASIGVPAAAHASVASCELPSSTVRT